MDIINNTETTEEIITSIETKVKMYVYSDNRETCVNKVWIHSDPVPEWFNIENIHYFREQNDSDNGVRIFESTKMPTEWCMMVYRDEFERKLKSVPVVGKVKELNERIETIKKNHYGHKDRLFRLRDKIKDMYLFDEIDDFKL